MGSPDHLSLLERVVRGGGEGGKGRKEGGKGGKEERERK